MHSRLSRMSSPPSCNPISGDESGDGIDGNGDNASGRVVLT